MRVAMNKPELYNASNVLQRQSTLQCLKENSKHIKWNREEDTAIDVGCGDGSVSVLVKNFAPVHFKKFVGIDISEAMVKFASKHYADDTMSFIVINIEGNIPEDLKGEFNHVFSFYALHWVKNQEKAFRNIYDLLSNSGDIFVSLIGSTAIYTIYKVLAHHPKWKTWLKDVDVFVSPYHEIQDAEAKVAEIVEKCGFKNVDVKCKPYKSVYNNVEELKRIVQSVEPFNMPQEVYDEFFKDYYTVGQEIGALQINCKDNGEVKGVVYDYTLILVCANKN